LVARRLRDGVLVLLLVLTAVFALGQLVGDPAESLAPADATHEQVEQIRHNLGLDRPILEQAKEYYGGLFTGHMGDSLVVARNQPALPLVFDRLGATFRLTIAGLFFSILMGVGTGLIAGVRPGSWFDRIGNTVAMAGVSFPYFWFGQILILIFAANLGWVSVLPDGGWSSYVLPGITLGLHHGGRLFQLVRSATVDELNKSYVTVATGKGLGYRAVVTRHILRNIALVLVTMVGWEYARMWGGTVFLVEFTFAWPGIGKFVTDAASRHDFHVVQAGVVVAGIFVVVSNLVVDLLATIVDRRVEVS
jgi:ABC-type dipeptide/oligopeptide/nickel transport system permease component